jgi:hypothetical protein
MTIHGRRGPALRYIYISVPLTIEELKYLDELNKNLPFSDVIKQIILDHKEATIRSKRRVQNE